MTAPAGASLLSISLTAGILGEGEGEAVTAFCGSCAIAVPQPMAAQKVRAQMIDSFFISKSRLIGYGLVHGDAELVRRGGPA